ncbi:hypothetical protein NEMBOFW57_008080 [Staphylotrichum longicolle]|uniref:Heterokaryon incompatibility domain-containing protein n=1 Tax=Staphylotrichum longicolle TaxID=669026 RepID=A0AAD4ER06_9PEZI|nr:hypothetical protein NEMBOFW57_008080 [Staphylotrichum longicolle]
MARPVGLNDNLDGTFTILPEKGAGPPVVASRMPMDVEEVVEPKRPTYPGVSRKNVVWVNARAADETLAPAQMETTPDPAPVLPPNSEERDWSSDTDLGHAADGRPYREWWDLNDNRDGTFSIVRSHKQNRACVVSRNRPGPDEPPALDPRLPLTTAESRVAERQREDLRLPTRTPSLGTARSTALTRNENIVNASGSADLWGYLCSQIGAQVPGPEIPALKLLLGLPRVRDLDTTRPLSAGLSVDLNDKQIAGLIIQVTGEDAPSRCTECRRHNGPFRSCIRPSREVAKGISGFLRSSLRACGNCFVRKNSHACSVKSMVTTGLNSVLRSQDRDEDTPMRDAAPSLQESMLGRRRSTRLFLANIEHEGDAEDEESGNEAPTPDSRPPRRLVATKVARPAQQAQPFSQKRPAVKKATAPPEADLHMEDWEMADGRVNTPTSDHALAFSSTYLTSNQTVPIAPSITFQAVTIPSGRGHQFPPTRLDQKMYEPLDSSRREIRLLQVVGVSDDGPIQCLLRTVGLDDPGLEFAALSYVWGDESITRDVLVQGHARAVTANLEAALRNFWRYFTENGVSTTTRWRLVSCMIDEPNGLTKLRRCLSSKDGDLHHESDVDEETDSEDEPGADGGSNEVKDTYIFRRITAALRRAQVGGGHLPIWVDALCINQMDPGEKSQQIPMMRDIYAKARCVFSWLGPSGHNNFDLALSTIRKLTARVREGYPTSRLSQDYPELCAKNSDIPPFNKYWEAISSFDEAEYFERIWIFQELWAADPKNIVFVCGDEHLPMSTLTHYRSWAGPLQTLHTDHFPYSGRFIPVFPLISQINRTKSSDVLKTAGATRVFLDTVRRSRCKDPRDKVFALFGIFPMDLTPDYTMPVADVYAAWAVNSHQDLALGSLIVYSGIGLHPRTSEAHNLASWQPDFERLGEQINWSDAVHAYKHTTTETPAEYQPTISPPRRFTCFGVQVATVANVATQAGKTAVDFTHATTRSMIAVHNSNGASVIPVLKHLAEHKHRFWAPAYHEKGSLLHALVEIVNECTTDGADPAAPTPTPGPPSGDALRVLTPHEVFRLALLLRDGPDHPTADELAVLGFQSEEELWACLSGIIPSSRPSDGEGLDPAMDSEPRKAHEDKDAVGFVGRLLIFSFNKNIFYTADGTWAGGRPGRKHMTACT